MKVIHLISGGDTGGAKTHILSLLSGLGKTIDVTLVCFMRGEFSEEAESLGIRTVIMEGSNPFTTANRLKKFIKTNGYDIIHSHGARGNFMASQIKNSCNIPTVCTVHSDPKLDYMGRPLANLIYGTLNKYAMRRSDYLIGVSFAMKDLLISRGFQPNDLYTIYNGIDFSVIPKCEDKLSYLRSLGLKVDQNSIVVGIAARLDPVKDISTLIRGFAVAEKECPNLRLIIAGDGSEHDMLKSLAQELGISEKVCFAGWVSDINTFDAAIDINTLTSLSETFPYAITEGARAHLPVVCSRVGGIPKLVINGKTGYLFTPGDYKTLGKHLAQLGKSRELRNKIGDALYEKAKLEFSVNATTNKQLDIYESILHHNELKKLDGREGVVICGAYGMENAGDDAILEAIVGEMRELDPNMPITALSRNPRETCKRYGINSVYMFNIPKFHKVMRKTKLYLSGGGSLIQNVTSRRSLWYYLHTIKAAKKLGNSVMMYGCGIGPITDSRDEKRISNYLNKYVDEITLRESHSKQELERLHVIEPRIEITADPALSLTPSPDDAIEDKLLSCGINPNGKYVGFCVRNWTGFIKRAEYIAKAADFVNTELNMTPVFIMINTAEDKEVTQYVINKMETDAALIEDTESPALAMGIASRMRTVVSMRLHALIFAASQGIPVIGISYDPKVTAFLGSIGEDNCLPFDTFTEKSLKSAITEAVSFYDPDIKTNMTVKRLMEAESISKNRARKLLNK